MSQFFQLHPDNPQQRLVNQAVEMVRNGAVIVYPTDSGYALGFHIGDKKALDRMRKGTYGQCHQCDKMISKPRLEAVPHARLCIECKSAEEEKKAGRKR